MSRHTFQVCISQVRATNLPKKDVFTKCDSFLVFSWDSIPAFKTPIIYKDYNPSWVGYENKFVYTVDSGSVPLEELLATRQLHIDCFSSHSLRKDSLIGRATVNLLIILAGPSTQQLTLFSDRGINSGLLELEISVVHQCQALIVLRDISARLFSATAQHFYIIASTPIAEYTSPICYNAKAPYWEIIGPFTQEADLESLLNSSITVKLFCVEEDFSPMLLAVAKIQLKKYCTTKREFIVFREHFFSDAGGIQEPSGIIEGRIGYDNLPIPCQMRYGYHRDGQIIDAAPLIEGLHQFPSSKSSLLKQVFDPYNPNSLIPSPFEVPMFDACEVQMQGHIINLQRPSDPRNITKELSLITQQLTGDPISCEIFYQANGMHVVINLLGPYISQSEATGSWSNVFQDLVELLLRAVQNSAKNTAAMSKLENITLLLKLFSIPQLDKTVKVLILKILYHVCNQGEIGQVNVTHAGGIVILGEQLNNSDSEIVLHLVKTFSALVFSVRAESRIGFLLDDMGIFTQLIHLLLHENSAVRSNCLTILLNVSQAHVHLQKKLIEHVLEIIQRISLEASSPSNTLQSELIELLSQAMFKNTQPEPVILNEVQLQCLTQILLVKNQSQAPKVLEILLHLMIHPQNLSIVIPLLRLEKFLEQDNLSFGLQVLRKLAEFSESGLALVELNLQVLMSIFQSENSVFRTLAKSVIGLFMQHVPKAHSIILTNLFELFQKQIELQNSNEASSSQDSNGVGLLMILSTLQELVKQIPLQSEQLDEIWLKFTQVLSELILTAPTDSIHDRMNIAWICLSGLLRHPNCFQVAYERLFGILRADAEQQKFSNKTVLRNFLKLFKTIVEFYPSHSKVFDAVDYFLGELIPERLLYSDQWDSLISAEATQILELYILKNQNVRRRILLVLMNFLQQTAPGQNENLSFPGKITNDLARHRMYLFCLNVCEEISQNLPANEGFSLEQSEVELFIQVFKLHLLSTDSPEQSTNELRVTEMLFGLLSNFPDFRSVAIRCLCNEFQNCSASYPRVGLGILGLFKRLANFLKESSFAQELATSLIIWLTHSSSTEHPSELHLETLQILQVCLHSPNTWQIITPVVNKFIQNPSESNAVLIGLFLEFCYSALLQESKPITTPVGLGGESVLPLESICLQYIEGLGLGNLFHLLIHPLLNSYSSQIRSLLSFGLVEIKTLSQNVHHETLGFQPLVDIAIACQPYFQVDYEQLGEIQQVDEYQTQSVANFTLVLLAVSKFNASYVVPLLDPSLHFLEYVFAVFLYNPAFEGAYHLYAQALSALSTLLRNNQQLIYSLPLEIYQIPQLVKLLETGDIRCVYGICKLLRTVFFDGRIQSQFVNCEGFFYLAHATIRLSSYLVTSADARKALEQIANLLVTSAQISALQFMIVQDGLIPVMLKLLTSARNEEILLPVLGFIYFLSFNEPARIELIDSAEIDVLGDLMDQRKKPNASPRLPNAAEQCFVKLGGILSVCTISSPALERQEYVECSTCGLSEVCLNCSQFCHKGHSLSAVFQAKITCQCGASPHCLIKERPSLRVQYPLRLCSFAFTGKSFAKQHFYYCRSCFRDTQKGICYTCTQFCHNGHDVRYGGETKVFCDCHDRYGAICRCAQSPPAIVPGKLPRKRGQHRASLKALPAPVLVEERAQEEQKSVPISEDDTCIICMDQPKEALFFRCGHIASCMECACLLKQRKEVCIICREPIEDVIRAYRV